LLPPWADRGRALSSNERATTCTSMTGREERECAESGWPAGCGPSDIGHGVFHLEHLLTGV